MYFTLGMVTTLAIGSLGYYAIRLPVELARMMLR
jgi:hypothetical protein